MTLLLGIDLGTSGAKAVLLDRDGQVHGFGAAPLPRLYPQPGLVEQRPADVLDAVRGAVTGALRDAAVGAAAIGACAIAGQRNTVFAWDADSGRPIGNAIVWQDLRTTELLREAQAAFDPADAWRRLGYPPGTYMGALHLAWRLRHDAAVQAAAADGTLRVGPAAAYVVHGLGQLAEHAADIAAVQAMGMFDFRAGAYWRAWCEWLHVPVASLPSVRPTVYPYGHVTIDGARIPVVALLGDQQAALFGHGCRAPGAAECTHGTNSFLKVVLGETAPVLSDVNTYIAWTDGECPTYFLEAPTTVTGAALRWLRDNLGLIDAYETVDAVAGAVPGSDGVVFVPALTGLDVPYNRPDVRGTLLGLTLGHNKAHIVRALLESVGLQLRGLLEIVTAQTALSIPHLRVGGGVAASDLACQIQADLTGLPIVRPTFTETTAFGAALFAGIGVGAWSADATPLPPGAEDRFTPRLSADARDAAYARWRRAVELVLHYA